MDTYTEHNPDAPWNEIEVEAEIVEFEELEILQEQVKTQTKRLEYKIWQLKQLAIIERSYKTFGVLTFDEQQQKNEILEQYLNN